MKTTLMMIALLTATGSAMAASNRETVSPKSAHQEIVNLSSSARSEQHPNPMLNPVLTKVATRLSDK